jgi:hypothetical protein
MSLILHRLEPVFTGLQAGYLEPVFQVIELGVPLIALGLMIFYYYGLNGWGVKAWDRAWHWPLFLLLSGIGSAVLAGVKAGDDVVKPIVTALIEDPNFFDQPGNQATLDAFQLKLMLVCFAAGAVLFVLFSFVGKAGSKHAWHLPVKWPRK